MIFEILSFKSMVFDSRVDKETLYMNEYIFQKLANHRLKYRKISCQRSILQKLSFPLLVLVFISMLCYWKINYLTGFHLQICSHFLKKLRTSLSLCTDISINQSKLFIFYLFYKMQIYKKTAFYLFRIFSFSIKNNAQKIKFSIMDFLVNVSESGGNCGFCHFC